MIDLETVLAQATTAALLSLTLTACGDDGDTSSASETSASATDTETGTGGEESGTNSGDGDGDPATGDGDGDASGDGDGDTSGDGDGDVTGDGDGDTSGDGDGDTSGDGDGDGCIPTEDLEVTCDNLDNDCDGLIDNIDEGADGFCDCLNIGILGATGFNPTADFETWLEEQGTTVTRTSLEGNPGIVTPELLATYDVLLIDRIRRALSPEEAAAVEAFVKDGGFGLITLIGYNFDNNNPAPERDRANSVLEPFGLAYVGGYVGNGNMTPTFDPMHPVSEDIVDVNYAGGMLMADNGDQGDSEIFATVPQGDAGLAHQTANDGGRVIIWGDEWLTFDSDWQGFADVQQFWTQMVSWAKPQDYCLPPPQ